MESKETEAIATSDCKRPSHASVVVIGGGVIGCSALYHLTLRGCTDAVLLEKNQLMAGSSWHAAGVCSQHANDLLELRLASGSEAIYREMAKDPETPVGLHICGSVWIRRMDDDVLDAKRFLGLAKIVGVDAEIVDRARLKTLYPLLDVSGLLLGAP